MKADFWEAVQLVALGRSTQEELTKNTSKVVFTCDTPTPAGVVDAVEKTFS
jgi:hypothetical protein